MKKIKIIEPVQKSGLFGKKTVMKTKTITVDNKTYKRMMKERAEKEVDEFEDFIELCEILSDD